jgi:hypothetical protein
MSQIIRLKISLDGMKPPVWRRIEVLADTTLDDLHLIVQVAMGWESCHLYAFRTPLGQWSSTDPDFGIADALSAETTTLAQLRRRGGARKFGYVYDFGDDWEHTVQVEAVLAGESGARYPRLLKAKGACPPEDVGGVWGYAAVLEAIADVKHEQHKQMIEWYGPDLDPTKVDEAALRRRLDGLARPPQAAKRGARAARP